MDSTTLVEQNPYLLVAGAARFAPFKLIEAAELAYGPVVHRKGVFVVLVDPIGINHNLVIRIP